MWLQKDFDFHVVRSSCFLLSPHPTLPLPPSAPSHSQRETHCPGETAMWQRTSISNQWPGRTRGAKSHVSWPWSGSSPNQALRWLQDHLTSFCFISVLFLPHHSARRILVPWPGIKLVTPGLGAWSLNPWTFRKYTSWHLNCSLRARKPS